MEDAICSNSFRLKNWPSVRNNSCPRMLVRTWPADPKTSILSIQNGVGANVQFAPVEFVILTWMYPFVKRLRWERSSLKSIVDALRKVDPERDVMGAWRTVMRCLACTSYAFGTKNSLVGAWTHHCMSRGCSSRVGGRQFAGRVDQFVRCS